MKIKENKRKVAPAFAIGDIVQIDVNGFGGHDNYYGLCCLIIGIYNDGVTDSFDLYCFSDSTGDWDGKQIDGYQWHSDDLVLINRPDYSLYNRRKPLQKFNKNQSVTSRFPLLEDPEYYDQTTIDILQEMIDKPFKITDVEFDEENWDWLYTSDFKIPESDEDNEQYFTFFQSDLQKPLNYKP